MLKRTNDADTVIALAGDSFAGMIDAKETGLRRIFLPKAYIISHFGAL